jgi:hypothetical protein
MMATTPNLTQEDETKLIQLMDQITCPAKFKCLTSNPENRCKVRVFHGGHIGECQDPDGGICHHSLTYGNSLLCTCEMRLFIALRE